MEKKERTWFSIIRETLNIGAFRPAFYLYEGRYQWDRDIKISDWRGPFKTRKAATDNVIGSWETYGLEKPKIRFKFFQPYECGKPIDEKWTVGAIRKKKEKKNM